MQKLKNQYHQAQESSEDRDGMVEIHSSGGGPQLHQHDNKGDSENQYDDQSEVDMQ